MKVTVDQKLEKINVAFPYPVIWRIAFIQEIASREQYTVGVVCNLGGKVTKISRWLRSR